ncbi:putative WW domain-binding protein [Septoria linicola]|nr:putative WW domain-binding protein [Septoria linicola]
MSEYWKSTPSYWCKFCSQYVRDTSIERKNHESSAKHQNNIQRSLRELHKGKEREERDKQRAKDEVNRLNGLVSGQKTSQGGTKALSASQDVSRASKPAPTPQPRTTAQQRKAHAEQLAAMGVELPEELKKEITGVGSYQVVDAQEVVTTPSDAVIVNRSLVEIMAEARQEQSGIKREDELDEQEDTKATAGVKRKADEDDEDDPRDEEAAPRLKKAWGSTVKTYPGKTEELDDGDLDALLGGVRKKAAKTEDGENVKQESEGHGVALSAVPDIEGAASSGIKQEGDVASTPAVVFKKRKGKK